MLLIEYCGPHILKYEGPKNEVRAVGVDSKFDYE